MAFICSSGDGRSTPHGTTSAGSKNGSGGHAVTPHVVGLRGAGGSPTADGGGLAAVNGVAASQLLHNVIGLGLVSDVGLDGGVVQEAVVKSLLGFGCLPTTVVHDESNTIVEEQMEFIKGSVLDAKRFQSGSVDLGSEIFQQKPGGHVGEVAVGPVLAGGPAIGGGSGTWPSSKAGRSASRFAPEILTHGGESAGSDTPVVPRILHFVLRGGRVVETPCG